MSDMTVTCPECNARLWKAREVHCVCGHTFQPTDGKPFLTGKEKKKLQDGTSASPAKGPQPVTGKKANRTRKPRG